MSRKSWRRQRYGVAWEGSRCARSTKVRYPTEDAAAKALADIMKAWWSDADRRVYAPSAIYRCDDCGGWHLTSKPKDDKLVSDEVWSHPSK